MRREAFSQPKRNLHRSSRTVCAHAHARACTWAGPRPQVPPRRRAFPLPTKGGAAAPAGSLGWRCSAKFSSGNGKLGERGPAALVSRAGPGVRETLKSTGRAAAPGECPQPPQGPKTRVGPQVGGIDARRRRQVLQEAEIPGPSHAPDTPDVGAALLVSDGTHSVRCLVTREALNASDW